MGILISLYTRIKVSAPSLAVLFFFCVPLFASAEEITNYDIQIHLNDDASFIVTETINYDFGQLNRHGIFRYILNRHPQESTVWYKERSVDISVLSVLRDGVPERYVVNDLDESVDIKIGKAESTIQGAHVYQIQYRVVGGLAYLDDGTTELYWNATGNNWNVPIKNTLVTVTPKDVLDGAYSCYQGSVYSSDICDDVTVTENGLQFSALSLQPSQGLTIAAELKEDVMPVVVYEKIQWIFIILPALAVLLVWGIYSLYRFKTFYKPSHRTVIAQYEPYPELLPMFSGILMDGRLDGRDVTAGLLYLAQSGFIKIKKIDRKVLGFISLDDYEITMQKNIPVGDDSALPSRFHYRILGLIFNVMSRGVTVKLSDIKKNTSRQQKNYAALSSLRLSVVDDLITRGFYERKFGIRRKTAKAYEAIWHLKGFKEFLSVTDKERFKFHNAPEKSPEQFLTYLPYAVAFGVEEEWAKVFKDMVIEQPDWYEGAPGAFSAVNIGQELNGFSVAANAASGSGYRSSSGGSASRGGGFSGGGGGGGGGGSW